MPALSSSISIARRTGRLATVLALCVILSTAGEATWALVGGSGTVVTLNDALGDSVSNTEAFTLDNPAPTLTGVDPQSIPAGSGDTVITATGTGFVTASTVNWNGSPLAATYVSGTSLTATVPAADLVSTGSALVTVTNPAPGGGTTDGALVSITTLPAPTGLTAQPGQASVTLSWQSTLGASSYDIFRGTASGGESTTPITTSVTSPTYTDNGLTDGTTYYYEVEAVNSEYTSTPSNEAGATPMPPPQPPSNLTATAGNMQISLGWTASSGATTYNLYRSGQNRFSSSGQLVTGLTGLTYTDTGLSNGTTYYYWVTAVGETGESGPSNMADATPIGPPPAPSNLVASGLSTQQSLVAYWPANGNYQDVVGGNNGTPFGGVTFAAGVSGQSFSFNGSTARIFVPDNPDLALTHSIAITVWIKPASIPGGQEAIYFRGDDRSSLDPYVLYMEGGGYVRWIICDANNDTAEVDSAHSIPVNTWTYVSASLDDATGDMRLYINGKLDASGQTSIRPFSTLDASANPGIGIGNVQSANYGEYFDGDIDELKVYDSAPPASVLPNVSNAITLTWTASSQASSYNIYRGTASNKEAAQPIATGVTQDAFADPNVTLGVTYYYKVQAVNAQGSSPMSNEASAEANSTPKAPTGVTATAGNEKVTLHWAASSDTSSYNVYRGSSSSGESSTPIATGIAGTSYTNAGLTNGTTYYYKIASVNVLGTSVLSSEVSATPMGTVPTAPQSLTAEGVDNKAIGLSWTASVGATSYNVYRGGTANSLAKIKSGVTGDGYVDTGLTTASTYFYRVAAVDAVGTSKGSNLASAAPVAPANHDLLVLQNASTHQVALWKMSGATVTSDDIFTPTPSPDWDVVGYADFNGDGQPDLLFQEPSTGDLAVWYMNGTTRLSIANFSQSPAGTWRVVGVGDFNGDGHPDLCLQNVSTGQVAIWLLDGLTKIGGAVLPWTPAAGWSPVGVGDFNGDGYADILFQQTVNTTGVTDLAVWYMQGITRIGIGDFTRQAGPGRAVVAVDNLTAAVEPDIVLEDGSAAYEWNLSGLDTTSSDPLSSTVPSGWSVVGPR